jgi:SAM-dependent methyltransferase
MLYHVPHPVQAVRELRRITRTGGRVIVGLNGPDHMRQLRALVAAERGGRRERLTLDDGQVLLAPYFSSVTRHDFVAELRLTDPGPVIDYIQSMSGTQHGDPEGRVAAAVAELFTAPGAVFTVTTHSGCLICTP